MGPSSFQNTCLESSPYRDHEIDSCIPSITTPWIHTTPPVDSSNSPPAYTPLLTTPNIPISPSQPIHPQSPFLLDPTQVFTLTFPSPQSPYRPSTQSPSYGNPTYPDEKNIGFPPHLHLQLPLPRCHRYPQEQENAVPTLFQTLSFIHVVSALLTGIEVLDLLYLHHMGRCDIFEGGLWSAPLTMFWMSPGVYLGTGTGLCLL